MYFLQKTNFKRHFFKNLFFNVKLLLITFYLWDLPYIIAREKIPVKAAGQPFQLWPANCILQHRVNTDKYDDVNEHTRAASGAYR